MTDFTLSSGSICRPYRTPWGAFHKGTYQVSSGVSSAAILTGRPVTLDWTANSTNVGKLKASTADATFFLVGIAANDVTGTTAVTGTPIDVYEANPMQEFKAVTKGGTLQSSQLGLRKTLHWDSTLNIAYVDLSASTAADWRVIVTKFIDNEGDSGGFVAFRFITRLTENIGSSIAITSTSPLLAFYS